jgi:UDP-GlcNAc:undecaprenyl-phosphate GlcNAc-1-phosphate transferase
MVRLVLGLIPISLMISLPLTALLVRVGHRMGTYDSAGVPGQVKARRAVPNTGGVAIFWAIVVPMLLGLVAAWWADPATVDRLAPGASVHLAGIRQQTPVALTLVACLLLLHVMGLIDDRRPMGPWVKLLIMLLPAAAVPILFPSTRLLTVLDKYAGGEWASLAVTVLWFLVVTNALNFMDNMDGLSAGVAAVAAGMFLAATLVGPHPQWFIAACLAMLVGSCLGFLAFNFPRRGGAKIFMGDGGSLVLGFLLAFLTVRTTYYGAVAGGGGEPTAPVSGAWYGVFMPLVVLAVPIYDFVSVVLIRLSQGRSPFVGDQQHLSHRLVQHGLSKASAVAVIYGLTAVTGISGISLGALLPWQAVLVGVQTLLILLVAALFEYSRAKAGQA